MQGLIVHVLSGERQHGVQPAAHKGAEAGGQGRLSALSCTRRLARRGFQSAYLIGSAACPRRRKVTQNMHKPSFCPDSRLSFQMMWKQQPALLPPTWSPLVPLLQHCHLLPNPGDSSPSPASTPRLSLCPGGSRRAQPLAFLLSMPSGGSLAFPVLQLMWLKPVQKRHQITIRGGAKLPRAASPAGIPTGDLGEERCSTHMFNLRTSSVCDEQALLQLLAKESNFEYVSPEISPLHISVHNVFTARFVRAMSVVCACSVTGTPP